MPGMLCMLRCSRYAGPGNNLDHRMLWMLQMLGMLWTPKTQLSAPQPGSPLQSSVPQGPTELSSAAGATEQPRGESGDAPSPGCP